MHERDYNEKSLTDYLLGSLPDGEAENFDERSFTDEDFSMTLKIVENDLIDAYLYDELRSTDLKRFNSYYLSSTLRREKVHFAKSLQIYAEKQITFLKSDTKNVLKPELAEKKGFFAAWRFSIDPVFGWSAAAFVLLIIGLGVFWINQRVNLPETEIVSTKEMPPPANIELSANSENSGATVQKTSNSENSSLEFESKNINKPPVIETSRPPKPEKSVISPKIAVASFILTPPLRGSQLPKISFLKETTLILMTLKTESNDYKSYRVALVDEANKKLWQSGSVRIKNEAINISFPANLLKTRIYSMVVSGTRDDEAEIISNYPFRAVPR